jgi:hypothetical protein
LEECSGGGQIGKAAAVITLTVSEYCTSKSRPDEAGLMKSGNIAVQSAVQSARGHRDLDNERILLFVGECFTAVMTGHLKPANGEYEA